MAAEGRGPGRALLVVLLLLLFAELPGTWLIDHDETRYAEIGREMLASGDWVTPTLNGARYDEKPPVTYWANAASMALFGSNAYAARLPVRLATLGTVILLLVLGRGYGPPGTAPWSAVLFLSAPLVFALGRLDLTDGILSFFLAGSFLCLREFLRAEPWSRRSMAWLAGLGLACGLSVLTKGLVGIVLPGLALLGFAAVAGRWGRVLESLASPAPLVCAAVVAPWFLLMEGAHPGFNRYFWWDNHFTRFTAMESGRDQGPWFPWAVVVGGFLPWVMLLWRPLRALRLKTLRADPDGLLLWLWFLVLPAFFTFSKSILIPYLLPALPAGALLAAREAAASGGRRWVRNGVLAMILLQVAAVIALPSFAEARSHHSLAERAAEEAGATVVSYRCHSNSFFLRFERPLPMVARRGEMATNVEPPPELFWTGREFWVRWGSGERMVVLVNDRYWEEFKTAASPEPRILDRAKRGEYLVANYPAGR